MFATWNHLDSLWSYCTSLSLFLACSFKRCNSSRFLQKADVNLKRSPLTHLWSCQKDFTNIMEGEKFSFITFSSFAVVAGFRFITGKGRMLPWEPHLSHQMAELLFAAWNSAGWNSAFQLQQGRSCRASKSRISCWKLSNELFHYEKINI